MSRALGLTASLVLCWAGLIAVLPNSLPTAVADSNGLLDEAQAMALARQTGKPVVVSAKTNETTLITADPTTGLFTAELSPRPARVPDGAGSWRDPSARLVQAADGSWHTEAGIADVTVSDGGDGLVASLSQGSVSAAVSWPDELPTPSVDADTATYSEVLPGVDLVVRADIDAVESYLVVKTPEAAQNPDVRSWSMPISTTGLTVRSDAGGVKSLVDSDGVAQMTVPKAMMWDSSGKGAAVTDTNDLLAEVPQTQTAKVSVKMTSSLLTASADVSFLDDPDTVYPVVIDPVLQLAPNLNHVLRVTTDGWTKWDSTVGSQGKIGYNGWTSPYYKSRMFYQINWPLNPDGSGLTPGQISQGIFQYTQTHSPQHSPCLSTSTSYPTERAKLATAILSTDTWSDRTDAGGGWHPQASVLPVTRMAVGHEDYCNKSYIEQWDMTSALKTERTDYSTRATVTVGIYSDDETDKMGWKYYTNNYGSSPKLLLSYQVRPPAPTALSVSNTDGAGRVASRNPTLSAQLNLAPGDACVGSVCMYGTFTLNGSDGSTASWTLGPVANGATVPTAIPFSLRDSTNYTLSVSAYSGNVTPTTYSIPATLSFTTSFPAPLAPAALAVSDLNGLGRVTSRTPTVSARLSLASNQTCGSSPCLYAAFTVAGSDGSSGSGTSGLVADGGSVSMALPALRDSTTYTVTVRTIETGVTAMSPPSAITFTTSAGAPQKPTSVSVSDTTVGGLVASRTPKLSATLSLAPGDSCVHSPCLMADFRLTKADGTPVATMTVGPVATNTTVQVTAPTLEDNIGYRLSVRAYSTEVSFSASSDELPFKTTPALGPIGGLKLFDGSGAAAGMPAVLLTGSPGLDATLPGGELCPAEQRACLTAALEVWSGTTRLYTWSGHGQPNDHVSPPDDDRPLLDVPGSYILKAWASNDVTGKSSDPVQMPFITRTEPPAPVLGDVLTVSASGVAVHLSNPMAGCPYTVTVAITPEGGDTTATDVVVKPDDQGNLVVPLRLTGSGEVAITTVKYTYLGVESAEWQGDLQDFYAEN